MRYRYRIEPTPAQQTMLARVFGCCRVVFNDALRVRDEAYRAGIKLSDSEIQRRVITAGQDDQPSVAGLAEVPSVALVQSVNDSRRAWRNFFDSTHRETQGPQARPAADEVAQGSPAVVPAHPQRILAFGPVGGCLWRRSARSGCAGRAICRRSRRRSRSSANPMATSTPVSSSTSQPHRCRRWSGRPGWIWGSRGWQRSRQPTVPGSRLRIRSIWVASCASWRGWSGRSPAGRRDQPTGTRSRRKVAVAHNEVARARRDYHHKQALALVRENQVIHVEDLNVVGMVKNRRLARAISDAGWGQFVRIVGEKADRYGRTVYQVSRWLASSKTCSQCGHRLDDLPLQVRQWTCPACRVVHDRDHNAAKVILAAGRAERLNACGAPVSPPTNQEARGVEAGSTPTAA